MSMAIIQSAPQPPPAALLQPEDGMQYRPEKDLVSFKNILPPEIEFMEGSSTGALAVPEGKYDPININKTALPEHPQRPPSPAKSAASPPTPSVSLYLKNLDFSWPDGCKIGAGLYNSGNSCFLNSALQCLLHTPPLLHILLAHNSCAAKGFCMTCSMRAVAHKVYSSRSAVSPSPIGEKLQVIAKHMRRGRQEDSHEFLRYAIDALQKSCLTGHPPKVDPKVAETTWVHKLFGGKLRSRVSCKSCGHNSDTFDSVLDLSLDIYNTSSLKVALRKFIAPDHLKGSDKYKCEKCKKHVDAEKRFSVHEAPVALTIHLKRFSPLGRKIGHQVDYEEHLPLKPYMSEGQYGPDYSLYGVVCHAGGGPNSGHYYAFVKSKDGLWYEMNDESVTRSSHKVRKSAYMLFYMQTKGQRLGSALHFAPSAVSTPKKRKADDVQEEEDQGTKVSSTPSQQPFIGPTLPSPDPKRLKLGDTDPQADSVNKKVDQVKKSIVGPSPRIPPTRTPQSSSSLAPLADYGSDSDVTDKENIATSLAKRPSSIGVTASSPPQPPPQSSPPSNSSPTPKSSYPTIPTATFYGTPGAAKAQKRLLHTSPHWRERGGGGHNPYSANRFKSSMAKQYGKRRIRGL